MRVPVRIPQCSICLRERPLTWEHVIPQSIGGTLEADLQCRDCNSNLGTQLVSQARKDPSLRLAIRQLKDELPDLFESMETGLPYLVTDSNDERLRAERRKGRYRIKPHQRSDRSIITETNEAIRNLRKILRKDGLSSVETESALARFVEGPTNIPVKLSDRTTIIKWSVQSTIEPHLSSGLMDDRVVALVAYNYLRLLLGNLVRVVSIIDGTVCRIIDGKIGINESSRMEVVGFPVSASRSLYRDRERETVGVETSW